MVGSGIVLTFALFGFGAAGISPLDQAVEPRDVQGARVLHMTVLTFTTFSRGQTRILTEQMEQIWGREGLTIRWACAEDDECVRVVLIEQRELGSADSRNRYGCLGSIPFLAHGPARTLYVAMNRVRELVDESVHFNTPTAVRELLVARVAGRAAAHELAHYLLATPDHSDDGLLRSMFSPEDLLRAFLEPFRLNDDQRWQLGLGPRPRHR